MPDTVATNIKSIFWHVVLGTGLVCGYVADACCREALENVIPDVPATAFFNTH